MLMCSMWVKSQCFNLTWKLHLWQVNMGFLTSLIIYKCRINIVISNSGGRHLLMCMLLASPIILLLLHCPIFISSPSAGGMGLYEVVGECSTGVFRLSAGSADWSFIWAYSVGLRVALPGTGRLRRFCNQGRTVFLTQNAKPIQWPVLTVDMEHFLHCSLKQASHPPGLQLLWGQAG